MGFTRVVLTDALCMKAIGDEKQAAIKALHAGAHALLAAEDSLALSDFLQAQNDLEDLAQNAICRQDALALRLPEKIKLGLSAAQFNQKYAANCIVCQGKPIILHPGQEITYLELGNEENFAAQNFLNALKTNGISIKKYNGESTETLLAVSFSNYKAFKGHINLSPAEQETLRHAAQMSKQSFFISFGSPFGSEKIDALSARLFCFSPAEESQVCAANILCDKQITQGKMPV